MDVAGDQLGQFSLSNAGRAEKKEDEWVNSLDTTGVGTVKGKQTVLFVYLLSTIDSNSQNLNMHAVLCLRMCWEQ